ncbi:MAG: hypothetical protein ACM34F_01565 [Betaproteobacteria bacterium]
MIEPSRFTRPLSRPPTLRHLQEGRWGYILAWLIGIPVPILILIYLLRGCT